MTQTEYSTGDNMINSHELQRQADNDAIAALFLEVAKARADRMKISYEEALAATAYILVVDLAESLAIGFKSFAGEFDQRRGKKAK